MKRKNTFSSSRPGFTIWEIIMTLSLLVIVLDIGDQLFRSTVLVSAETQRLDTRSARIDSALFRLRQDVWQSKGIRVIDPQSIDLQLDNGKEIAWKIDVDGSVQRSSGPRWPRIANGWNFQRQGASLVVSDWSPQSTGRVELVSQVLLLAGSK